MSRIPAPPSRTPLSRARRVARRLARRLAVAQQHRLRCELDRRAAWAAEARATPPVAGTAGRAR